MIVNLTFFKVLSKILKLKKNINIFYYTSFKKTNYFLFLIITFFNIVLFTEENTLNHEIKYSIFSLLVNI